LIAIVAIAALTLLGRNLYSIFYGISEALQFGCGSVSAQTFRSYAGEGGGSGPVSPAYQPTTGHVSQGYWFCHKGLDIAGPEGTPVQTVANGTVKYAGWNTQGYGNLVVIDHGSYQTLYAHLRTTPTVSKGQTVGAGHMVGELGNTGFSTGPHLHFEIRLGSDLVDPQIYLP
jgi:murein DD-endopeptidase MepM/ murein hydrolase activator NlpD